MGNVAIIVSILGFGASTDYTAALLWRLIPSAFIGSPIAVRALVGEAYGQEGQATALGVFNVGASLGFVLGESSVSHLVSPSMHMVTDTGDMCARPWSSVQPSCHEQELHMY